MLEILICMVLLLGNVSTQILNVVSKDKKKAILKNSNVRSLFFNHIRWLQKSTEKPDYYKNLPDKFFDLSNDSFVKNLDK